MSHEGYTNIQTNIPSSEDNVSFNEHYLSCYTYSCNEVKWNLLTKHAWFVNNAPSLKLGSGFAFKVILAAWQITMRETF